MSTVDKPEVLSRARHAEPGFYWWLHTCGHAEAWEHPAPDECDDCGQESGGWREMFVWGELP